MEFKRLTQGRNFKNFLAGMLVVLIVIAIIFIIKKNLPKDVLAILIVAMAYYTYKEYKKESTLNNTKYILENNVLTINASGRASTVTLSDINYMIENDISGLELKLGITRQTKYWLVLKDNSKVKIYDEMKNNRNKSIVEFLNRNCGINTKSVHKFSADFILQLVLGVAVIVVIVLLRR